jgi:hypothetical protein
MSLKRQRLVKKQIRSKKRQRLDQLRFSSSKGFYPVFTDNSKHAIVKTNRSTGESSVIYEFDRNNWTRADTSGVITFDRDGNIVQQVAGCSKNSSFITDYFHYTCYTSVTP